MGIPGCGRWCGYRLGEPLFPANSPDTWDTLADFLGRAGGGVLVVLVMGGAGWGVGIWMRLSCFNEEQIRFKLKYTV